MSVIFCATNKEAEHKKFDFWLKFFIKFDLYLLLCRSYVKLINFGGGVWNLCETQIARWRCNSESKSDSRDHFNLQINTFFRQNFQYFSSCKSSISRCVRARFSAKFRVLVSTKKVNRGARGLTSPNNDRPILSKFEKKVVWIFFN